MKKKLHSKNYMKIYIRIIVDLPSIDLPELVKQRMFDKYLKSVRWHLSWILLVKFCRFRANNKSPICNILPIHFSFYRLVTLQQYPVEFIFSQNVVLVA